MRLAPKCRGDPLEELIRILGLLTQFVVEKIDNHQEPGGEPMAKLQQHAAAVLRLLVRLLKLKIPTCGAKPEALADGPPSLWMSGNRMRNGSRTSLRGCRMIEPPVSAAVLNGGLPLDGGHGLWRSSAIDWSAWRR